MGKVRGRSQGMESVGASRWRGSLGVFRSALAGLLILATAVVGGVALPDPVSADHTTTPNTGFDGTGAANPQCNAGQTQVELPGNEEQDGYNFPSSTFTAAGVSVTLLHRLANGDYIIRWTSVDPVLWINFHSAGTGYRFDYAAPTTGDVVQIPGNFNVSQADACVLSTGVASISKTTTGVPDGESHTFAFKVECDNTLATDPDTDFDDWLIDPVSITVTGSTTQSTPITVPPGWNCQVTETESDGLTIVGDNPVIINNVQVGTGGSVFAFTNNNPVGSLTLIKTVDNLGESGPEYLGVSDFPLSIDGNPTTSGTAVTVNAGDYTIAETPQPGYTVGTWGCDDGTTGTAGSESTTVNVSGGEAVECTITNTLIANPLLTVEKSSTTTSLSAPATVTYSYLVTNTGNVTVTGISLSDDNDNDDMSCPAATLPPAPGVNSMTCTATHTFSQAELDAGGTLDNVVTAASNEAPDATDDLSIPITQTPGLTVEKSSTTTSLSAPGTVTYSYLVTNTGNVTVTGISLSDDNDNDDMSCPAATLPPAPGVNSMTCTATHTFSQAELDAGGTLDNVVTAASNEAPDATDDLSIPITQTPGLTVEKSSTTTSLSAPGTVTYSYLVTNTGNVTVTGISLSDDNDNDDMSCPAATLPPAPGVNSMTCTATHTFSQAELDAGGTLDNVVTAASNEAPDATDDLSIPITQTPGLTVEKSSTTTSLSAPGTVTYSYLVTNTGNVTVTGISLSDDNDNDDMSCPAATLPPAPGVNSMTCTATHTFSQAELDAGGTLDNVVTAASNEAPDATDDLSIPITQTPGLTVEKSSTTTSLSAPGTVTYSYLVTNTGNVTVTGISLSDDNDNDDMSCPAATLPPAPGVNSMTCTATHTFSQAELDAGGTLDNVVTAASNEAPDATDDLSIPITQTPGLTVEKSSTTTSLSAPGTVTYSYLVTNTGNVTVTGISLSDDNDNDDMSCPAATLPPAPGVNSMTCTATHTFSQAELDAGGTLDNVVTAASNEAPDATDDLSIPITQTPGLTVEKSSTTTSLSAPGTVTYSYLVTNTGNVTVTGISLSDDNDNDDMSCPAATLPPAPGVNSMTCTATHTFSQAELDAGGTLDNVVTAASNEAPDATDDLSIPITQTPGLTVEKSSTTTSLSAPGTVTYSYLVTNTGNVTVTGISLSDDNDNDDMSCPAATLPPAPGVNSMTCTATHTFSQAELDAGGTLDNVVTAASNEAPDATDDLSIPITQTPGLTVEKSSTTTSLSAPGTVTYSYLVTNTGNVTVTGISLSDDNDNDDMSCPAATLPPAPGVNSMTCTATHTFSQAELDAGGTLDNVVTAASNEAPDATDDLSIPITQTPAIDMVKSVGLAIASACPTAGYVDSLTVTVGDQICYQFEVTNTGNVTLTDVSVSDPMLSATAICEFASLAAGATATCTFGPVPAVFSGGQAVVNTAAASGCIGAVCVRDTDTARYVAGFNGFTPGFWKNHTSANSQNAWQEKYLGPCWSKLNSVPGVLPWNITVKQLFTSYGLTYNGTSTVGNLKLINALGGTGKLGAEKTMIRAVIAAYLNACFSAGEAGTAGDYPLTMDYILNHTIAVLATPGTVKQREAAMLAWAAPLDLYNNTADHVIVW